MKILPYTKKWQQEFQKEKHHILSLLGKQAKRIEHIGSAAIPKMSSKPIVDIAVMVPSTQNPESFFCKAKTTGLPL